VSLQIPFCRVRSRFSEFSLRAKAAFDRYGRCCSCGALCDGHHSYKGGPLLCDHCCPHCNPTLTQVS
jgi:hypothetical protein